LAIIVTGTSDLIVFCPSQKVHANVFGLHSHFQMFKSQSFVVIIYTFEHF